MKNQRWQELDCARALSMLWIVGVYHLRGYTSVSLSPSVTRMFEVLTLVALATFTFLSAFFLGNKEFFHFHEVWSFYKRRLLRIYPLFLASCVTLYCLGMIGGGVKYFTSPKQFLLTLVGLGCFVTPAPKTVWYVSMLLFFYLLTPFVLYHFTLSWKVVLVRLVGGSAIFLLIYALDDAKLLSVDGRFFRHFVIYFGVLLLASALQRLVASPRGRFGVLFGVPVLASALWFPDGCESALVISLLGIAFFCGLGKCLVECKPISIVSSWIGFGSMVAYLFHRQFFAVFVKCFGIFSPLLAAILLILLIVISYYCQVCYDFLLRRISNTKRISS